MKRSSLGLIPAVGFAVFFLLERNYPLRERRSSTAKRLRVNAGISALAAAASAAIVQPFVEKATLWNSDAEDLIGQASSEIRRGRKSGRKPKERRRQPGPIASFLLLDFAFYLWHRVNHAFDFFWRFHNIHHIDPDLDVSTGSRFHPVEVAFSAGFRFLQILLIGAPPRTVRVYDTLFQLATFFHHSNLDLGRRWDRRLNHVIVTPRMHGIHHSQIYRETDSNYGVIFSWWDRICGSHRSDVPQSRIKIGVPAYSEPKNNAIAEALLLPFKKQREYWKSEQ